jgi:hypothetical protein
LLQRPKVVHIADYAPGGRTKCHHCNTVIKKGELRIGINCLANKLAEHYYHLNCVRQIPTTPNTRVRFEDIDLSKIDDDDDHDVIRLVLDAQVW